MMSTRSGRIRQSVVEASPPRTRKGVSPTRSPARNRKSSPTLRSSQKSPSRKSPSRKPTPKYPARKSPSRSVKENKEGKETRLISESPSKRPAINKDAEVRLEDVSGKIELLRYTRSRHLEYSVTDFPITLPKTDIFKADSTKNEDINGIEELEIPRKSLDDIGISIRNRRAIEEIAPRRSSRLKEIVAKVPDTRHSFSKSLSKSVGSKSISKSIASYSDEEDFEDLLQKENSKSQSVTRKLATPLPNSSILSNLSNRFEFAGRVGVIPLYVLLPLTVFYILLSCIKICSYKTFKDLLLYRSLSIWFNAEGAGFVISNLILQIFFLSVPMFATKDIDDKGRKYYFNASFATFFSMNILFTLDYYDILKTDTLLNSYLHMATISYLIAVFLAFVMFLKSRNVDKSDLNPYGNSGYVLYDFFIGREINAVIYKTNIKLLLSRVSNISTLIFTIIIFKQGFHLQDKEFNNFSLEEIKNRLNNVHFEPTILVYSIMQMMYALYFIMGEKKIVSTFYWHSEGLGYLQIVASSLYPYYFTTVSKYVADSGLKLTSNTLIAASTLYLLGFLIMLISNNIKYEFRKNPLQPSLMHLDSMPTFHGKKLLISNLWGVLRHPNYMGDILIHAALAMPGILSRQIIAASPPLLTIVMLLHRCMRDHDRCRRRYGAAWQRQAMETMDCLIMTVFKRTSECT